MYDLQDKSHKKEKVEQLCRYVLGSWFLVLGSWFLVLGSWLNCRSG